MKQIRIKLQARWILPLAGLAALVWFLVRVIPKPSRAAYPCQRAAAPIASSFVLWLLAFLASTSAYVKGKTWLRKGSLARAYACMAAALIGAVVTMFNLHERSAAADTQGGGGAPHTPIGVGKGIFPGRVVWVHAPDATDSNWVYTSNERWWATNHTAVGVVEEMLSAAIRGVAGAPQAGTAWTAIFQHFNETHGRGSRGYQTGEKIAIKLNLVTCGVWGSTNTYEKTSYLNDVDVSPQMIRSLLRQLVYEANVPSGAITVGDPTALFPNHIWDMIHPEFPEVHCLDKYGGAGRTQAVFSTVPAYWSTNAADGTKQDYIPTAFADADYLINFAVLKGHSSGISVCGKNLYGSLIRTPDGAYQGIYTNYYDLHLSLPNAVWSPGTNHYRAIVDLMGHRQLGGKTMLCLVDGLFGGYYWNATPRKWKMPPFGNGDSSDWPSSLFASQDPVAIDSVCHDFLKTEWPSVVANGGAGSLQGGAEDYLHEAALAGSPPSGTFYDPERDGTNLSTLGVHDHWNNSTNRQYGRNLGYTNGIELVDLTATHPVPMLGIHVGDGLAAISWRDTLSGYSAEQTDALGPTSNWTRVTETPSVLKGRFRLSVGPVTGNHFYRLSK